MCTTLTRWLIDGRSEWKDWLMDGTLLLMRMFFMSVNFMLNWSTEFKCQMKLLHTGLWTASSWECRLTKKGNIVVSCFDLYRILEYTPIGSCVREIQVDAINGTSIRGLQHAIQLDDDRFVICHTTTKHHRVCIIDSNGRMMKSYGGNIGSGIGQMNGPRYLAVDRNGFILVVDRDNNRIIQLNASLEFIKE